MQKIVWGVVAGIAIIGWIVAYTASEKSDDLEAKLEASETKLATSISKQNAAEKVSLALRESNNRLNNLKIKVDAARDSLAALTQQADAKRNQLQTLLKKVQAHKSELSDLTTKVDARGAELSKLRNEIEAATANLGQIRSRMPEQPDRMANKHADSIPTKNLAIAETQRAARTTGGDVQGANPIADAKQRFGSIDENGDKKIDMLEFSLNKIQALNLIDSNQDGVVTMNETLLSVDAFKRFDRDDDGKITAVEFIDSRSFAAIDADGDGLVTIEEYLQLISEQ